MTTSAGGHASDPDAPPDVPAAHHWSARPWFALVVGVALVAPWLVLLAAPSLSPVIVFGGPVVAGLVAGYLADRSSRPGLIAGFGHALPALVVLALDPCRTDPGWGETAGGAVLLALLGPVVGVIGSRLGAHLAHGPSPGSGPLVWLVLVLAAGVACGSAIVAGQAFIAGC